ncbi:MAG: acyl-CoA dehydrogenase family protein, partial [Nitrospinota bacterium]|nr:acyl-CoA dehydrogenase family protein [Nitrospinota bacterium]
RFTRSGKVFSDKAGLKTIELALDVLGGMGIMRDSPSEKIVRDILTFQHGDGTDSACLLEAANTLEIPA